MTGVLAWSGWLAAVVLLLGWASSRRQLGSRMEALARAGHELRGPLTAIRLGVASSRLGSAAQRVIEVELARAGLALEDLAAIPRGEKPGLRPGSVDLPRLLADSVHAWQPSAAAAGVELTMGRVAGPPLVRGDRVRLAQATENLIANAIEHGSRRVEVCGTAWKGGARIEVRDDGPGLPAPVETLIRRPRGGYGPRGRGLVIAAGVATAHRGRLAGRPAATSVDAARPGASLVLEWPIPAEPGPDAG